MRVNGTLQHLGLARDVVWSLRGGRRPSASGQSVCTCTRPVQLWSPIVSLPATFVGSRSRGSFESKAHGCLRSHLRGADKRQGVWTCPIKTPTVHVAGVWRRPRTRRSPLPVGLCPSALHFGGDSVYAVVGTCVPGDCVITVSRQAWDSGTGSWPGGRPPIPPRESTLSWWAPRPLHGPGTQQVLNTCIRMKLKMSLLITWRWSSD